MAATRGDGYVYLTCSREKEEGRGGKGEMREGRGGQGREGKEREMDGEEGEGKETETPPMIY